MGLDIVELVLDVEAEFDVNLPQERVSRMRTVGELHNVVADALGITDEEGRGALWSRVLDAIEKSTGVDRIRLAPHARFVEGLGLE